eukprot:783456_1
MNSRSELKELLESGLDEEEAIQALEMSMKCNHEDVGSSISDKHQQTNDHSSDDSKNQSNYDAAHSSNQASRHKPHPLTQEENMNILKPPHDMDPETQIKELTDAGLTKLEAFMALHMSMKHNDANTLETDMDLDFVEAVNCLQNLGFTESKAVVAFAESHYRLDSAIQYLTKEHVEEKHTEMPYPTYILKSDINSLIQMGFTKHQSVTALKFSHGHLQNAIDGILQQCTGQCKDIKECGILLNMSHDMRSYDGSVIDDDIDILRILNNFNHLLFNHDFDEQFAYIYDRLGGECNIEKCEVMKRHFRQRNVKVRSAEEINDIRKLMDAGLNENEATCTLDESTCYEGSDLPNATEMKHNTGCEQRRAFHFEILDRIHCHFMHSYDVGCRLRPELQPNDEYKQHGQVPHRTDKFSRVKPQLQRNDEYKQNTNASIPHRTDKFNQLNNATSLNQGGSIYSTGIKYYYWEWYKHSTINDGDSHPGYYFKHWYVAPKYKDLKEELLHNCIAVLTIDQYKNEYQKASTYHGSRRARTLKTKEPHIPDDHRCSELKERLNIPNGTQISINHLLGIVIYCNYTRLQYEFSKTFRVTEDLVDKDKKDRLSDGVMKKYFTPMAEAMEGISEITGKEELLKRQHSNFHHLAKNLSEAMIFSKNASMQNISKFYHGIDKSVSFKSMICYMNQPFSTTWSLAVAQNFCGEDGMILQMHCCCATNYFRCDW